MTTTVFGSGKGYYQSVDWIQCWTSTQIAFLIALFSRLKASRARTRHVTYFILTRDSTTATNLQWIDAYILCYYTNLNILYNNTTRFRILLFDTMYYLRVAWQFLFPTMLFSSSLGWRVQVRYNMHNFPVTENSQPQQRFSSWDLPQQSIEHVSQSGIFTDRWSSNWCCPFSVHVLLVFAQASSLRIYEL